MNGPRFLSLALISCLGAPTSATASDSIRLTQILRYETGVFDRSAAEIVAFSPESKRLYVVNGAAPSIDILQLNGDNLKNATMKQDGVLGLSADESPTSVSTYGGMIAAAVHQSDVSGKPGKVVLFSSDGKRINEVKAGSLPDMVTFTPDGKYVIAANEGEPGDDMDPHGSVTIIDLSTGAGSAKSMHVTFDALDADTLRQKGVRIFPGKTPAEDFEPEYVAVSGDSKTAFVALQENNALAKIDIASGKLLDILPLGTKDHSAPNNGFDPSDKDDAINIGPVPVRGMYMPDTIATFEINGETFIISANEGDARDEDERVKKARIDSAALTDDQKSLLERLNISTIDGDTDGDGDIDILHSYGARSVSIWGASGTLISDTGDDFEQITSKKLDYNFNATNDKNKGENRSDDKGPEPEAVDTGVINGKTYAFIGLERVGGIMIYNISDPAKPQFVSYENNRNFAGSLDFNLPGDLKVAGDLGPECVLFISAEDSPYGVPLLAVASEVSGTVTVYAILPG